MSRLKEARVQNSESAGNMVLPVTQEKNSKTLLFSDLYFYAVDVIPVTGKL